MERLSQTRQLAMGQVNGGEIGDKIDEVL